MNTQHLTTFPPRNPAGSMQATVRTLGWVSLGLGVLGILAPRGLSRNLGIASHTSMMAGFGVREITVGVGILTSADPRPWIWSRVAGDALDVTALANGTTSSHPRRGSALLALAAVGAITIVDVVCAQWLTNFQTRRALPVPDYSDRSGFLLPAEQMRGKAAPVASQKHVIGVAQSAD